MRCLGWIGDERDRAFFRWKHHENPFGRSPGWVAETAGRIVGFRTFLRWRFVHGTSDAALDVVRAVDTATDPDFRGRGIFRDLTMTAIEELQAAGVDAVFNTPNDQSRPGYLKMGWVELGRPTVWMRPLSVRSIPRLAGARAAAELWPEASAPAHGDAIGELPAQVHPERPTWRTERTEAYRRWRYGFEPLGYRQTRSGSGGSVYRLRRRGAATEVSICEFHGDDPGLGHDVRRLGDYALALGRSPGMRALPVPRQGPVVTWRALATSEVPQLDDLELGLGDIELF